MKRLILTKHGFSLVLRGNTVAVLRGKSEVERVSLDQLSEVIVMAYGNVSVQVITALGERGIPIMFFRGSRYISMLTPLIVGTVITRREQYRAYEDLRGFIIAKRLVAAKMDNQRAVLGTMAKNRKASNPELARKIYEIRDRMLTISNELGNIQPAPVEKTRGDIMTVESQCASLYWSAIRLLYQKIGFTSRERFAEDPINAALNLGYAILAGEVERAIHIAGLDPYGGFLHADRSGRKSLVYDVMEQFRPHIVDRTIFSLASHGKLQTDSVTLVEGRPRLTEEARKEVVSAILSRLSEKVYWKNARRTWSTTIVEACSNLASYLRGQDEFTPFRMRW